MSDTTDPAVPLVIAPATQAMALSTALRQAAVDIPRDLPPGLHLSATFADRAARVVVTVAARNAYGVVAWEQQYDGTGKRLQIGAGLTF